MDSSDGAAEIHCSRGEWISDPQFTASCVDDDIEVAVTPEFHTSDNSPVNASKLEILLEFSFLDDVVPFISSFDRSPI